MYKIKIRHVRALASGSDSVVLIGLQLYKVDDNCHTVDIQRLSGNLNHYLEFCALFLSELKLDVQSP